MVESTEEEEDKRRRWWVVKCGNRWRKEKRKTNVWVYLVCGILINIGDGKLRND